METWILENHLFPMILLILLFYFILMIAIIFKISILIHELGGIFEEKLEWWEHLILFIIVFLFFPTIKQLFLFYVLFSLLIVISRILWNIINIFFHLYVSSKKFQVSLSIEYRLMFKFNTYTTFYFIWITVNINKADLITYFFLSKNNVIRTNLFDFFILFITRRILGLPFWLFRTIIRYYKEVLFTICEVRWLEKNKIYWLKIFFYALNKGVYHNFGRTYYMQISFSEGKRFWVENYQIFTNDIYDRAYIAWLIFFKNKFNQNFSYYRLLIKNERPHYFDLDKKDLNILPNKLYIGTTKTHNLNWNQNIAQRFLDNETMIQAAAFGQNIKLQKQESGLHTDSHILFSLQTQKIFYTISNNPKLPLLHQENDIKVIITYEDEKSRVNYQQRVFIEEQIPNYQSEMDIFFANYWENIIIKETNEVINQTNFIKIMRQKVLIMGIEDNRDILNELLHSDDKFLNILKKNSDPSDAIK